MYLVRALKGRVCARIMIGCWTVRKTPYGTSMRLLTWVLYFSLESGKGMVKG